ncbi:hypothetical protein PybrP1_008920, partial [[Pythium] brassicae (nom. inval.)]
MYCPRNWQVGSPDFSHTNKNAFASSSEPNDHTKHRNDQAPPHTLTRTSDHAPTPEDGVLPTFAELLACCREGTAESVRELLSKAQEGSLVNQSGKDSATPLTIACTRGDVDIVETLLAFGASVDQCGEWGRTPLYCAAREGYEVVVELLLSRGASIDAKDSLQRTPLHRAATEGRTDVVRLLLSRGARVDANDNRRRTPLHLAATKGHTDVVEMLLASSARIEASEEDGRTLSLKAIHSDRLGVAERHATRGDTRLSTDYAGATLLYSTDRDGNTPLQAASRAGRFGAVRVLLQAGAPPTVRAADGETLLISAARFGDSSVVPTLSELGWLSRREAASDDIIKQQQVVPSSAGSATLPPPPLEVDDRSGSGKGVASYSGGENKSTNDGHFFQLAMIAFHSTQLMPVCSSPSVFTRLVASTNITTQIRDLHTEVTFLEQTVRAESTRSTVASAMSGEWDPACLIKDEVALLTLFRGKITDSDRSGWFALAGAGVDEAKMLEEAASLLRHEVEARGESCSAELLELLKLSLHKLLAESDSTTSSGPSLPGWFIPPHELNIDLDAVKEMLKRRRRVFEVVTSGRWTGTIHQPPIDSSSQAIGRGNEGESEAETNHRDRGARAQAHRGAAGNAREELATFTNLA